MAVCDCVSYSLYSFSIPNLCTCLAKLPSRFYKELKLIVVDDCILLNNIYVEFLRNKESAL